MVPPAVAAGVAVSLIVAGAEPSSDQVETQRFTVRSGLLHRDLEQILLVPDAAPARRSLLVLLHGRTDGLDGPKTMLSDELFDALEALGAVAVLRCRRPLARDLRFWRRQRTGCVRRRPGLQPPRRPPAHARCLRAGAEALQVKRHERS